MTYASWHRRGWVVVAALAVGCGGPGPARFDEATERVVSALAALPAATTPARQIAPLAGSLTGSARPVLSWTGPDAAAIQICADHGCQHTLGAFLATGHHGQPLKALPVGVVYWRIITLGPRLTINLSPSWEMFVAAGNAASANATRGQRYDADADGYADAAVRELNFDTPTDLLHVYYGGAGGLTVARESTVLLDPLDFRGSFLTAFGDVNGDGYGDVAVSDGSGVVLYAGSATGVDATPLSVTPAPVSDNGHRFGSSLAALGDVNGDGYGDLAVGDGDRVVWVFLGGTAGFAAAADWMLDRTDAYNQYIRLLTTGDLNGDGYGDLVVTEYSGNGGPHAFRYFRGSASGLESPTGGTYVLRPNFPSGAAGDVDGDGIVDLVTSEVTALAVFPGGLGFPATPTQTIPVALRPEPIQLGDFDGDGDADLVTRVSTPTSAIYYSDDRVDIYAAGPAGLATTPAQTFLESDVLPDDELIFGSSLCNADFNRDGRDDLLVGAEAPYPAPLSGTTASVFVFPGTPTGVAMTPAPRLDAPVGFAAHASAGSSEWH